MSASNNRLKEVFSRAIAFSILALVSTVCQSRSFTIGKSSTRQVPGNGWETNRHALHESGWKPGIMQSPRNAKGQSLRPSRRWATPVRQPVSPRAAPVPGPKAVQPRGRWSVRQERLSSKASMRQPSPSSIRPSNRIPNLHLPSLGAARPRAEWDSSMKQWQI